MLTTRSKLLSGEWRGEDVPLLGAARLVRDLPQAMAHHLDRPGRDIEAAEAGAALPRSFATTSHSLGPTSSTSLPARSGNRT